MKSLGEFIVEKQAEYPHARGELFGHLVGHGISKSPVERQG